MARYRVGSKFLSEREYDDHVDGYWILGLFIFGCILAGYIVNMTLLDYEISKNIRFIIAPLAAISFGVVLSMLQKYIRLLLMTLFFITTLGLLISVAWSVI